MGAIAVAVTIPGWPENIWAIEVPAPRTHQDVRILMGAMSRCIPPRVPGNCDYELTQTSDGLTVRIWRSGSGEVRTCAPLDLPADTVAAFGVRDGRVTDRLGLDSRERSVSDCVVLQPMGSGA